MRTLRERKSWIVLLAILALFAACKGESPTAPPSGGGIPPGSTTPPPTGVTLTVTASNTSPLVDSDVVITATVTLNGQPVINGTAVEFQAGTGGVLDNGGTSIIKTTTNGVATVTLTSGTPGTVRVSATVNNVTRTVDVTFRARSTTTPQPSTAPTITSVVPAIGKPAGGDTIRINGTNFRERVRVLFDVGRPLPVEAFVVNVTPTTIEAITPGVDLGAGQQLVADIIVITEAGTTTEQSVESTGAFTFRNEQLTPRISTASPNSGPVTGGTMVKIFGDGFQSPVQVLFNTAEARVIEVKYNEITVETPSGRDTSPTGNGPVVGPVDIIVRNITSATSTTLPGGFLYKAALQITAVGPNEGEPTGGTRVQIDGVGFLGPVTVTIAGVAAQPIDVSGTRIIAITGDVDINGCADISGPVTVSNVNNGDSASGGTFTYRVPRPIITAVTSPVVPGAPIVVTVLNAGAFPQLRIGTRGIAITGTSTSGNVTTFNTNVPSNVQLDTVACPAGGERPIATTFDLTFTSLDTGCTVTLEDGLTVNPEPLGRLFTTPNPLNITATGDDPVTPADEEVDGTGFFTIVNTGASNLTITGVASSDPANFQVSSAPPAGTVLAPCESAIVSITYEAGTRGSATSAQITVSATTGVAFTPITARETVVGRTQ